MSLLPATSHANPTTPFWATAGSGGGGGGGKLIRIPDLNPTVTGFISYGTTVPMADIVIPDEIAVGDVFIFQVTFIPNDYDTNAGTPGVAPYGNLLYKLAYEIDANPIAFLQLNAVDVATTDGFEIQTGSMTFVGYRNDSFTPINFFIQNNTKGLIYIYYNVILQNMSFTKIGTGYVPLPP